MGRWLCLVAVLGGCDAAFGISNFDHTPDAQTINYDRCAPGLFANDPLRHGFVPGRASWQDTRAACQQLGMDLAVFHDVHEMGTDFTGETWPFWFGMFQDSEGTWQNVDGCPVFGTPSPPVLAQGGGSVCAAMVDALAPVGTSCDGSITASPGQADHVLGAVCQTPRPESAACLPADPTVETYTVGPALPYAEAVSFCADRHAHLVEVSSFAELGVLSSLVHERSLGELWFAPTFDGVTWHTATGCVAEFSWARGVPSFAGAGPSCLAGIVAATDDGPSLQGMDVAACTEPRIAVCETE